MQLFDRSSQNYTVVLPLSLEDPGFDDDWVEVSREEDTLQRPPAEEVRPYYALREIDGEIVVDLCEVRGFWQHIVRACYLRAANAMALQSLLAYCPSYPIASSATPTLRCRAQLDFCEVNSLWRPLVEVSERARRH